MEYFKLIYYGVGYTHNLSWKFAVFETDPLPVWTHGVTRGVLLETTLLYFLYMLIFALIPILLNLDN